MFDFTGYKTSLTFAEYYDTIWRNLKKWSIVNKKEMNKHSIII